MKVLITGSNGFVGQYLHDALRAEGYAAEDIFTLNQRYGQDLRDYETVREVINVARPDKIFHLAALAFVPESFADPGRAIMVNTIGSLNILEAVRKLGLKTKIMLAGTSEEYGDAQYGDGIITEGTKPNPLSPYAISKLAMDHLGRLYSTSYGMHVVVTRAFNHTGPGRGEMYAESAFAKQVAEVERGTRDIIKHGNLASMRNYTDVRDMVQAYLKAIELPPDVYNICSDQNVTMQQVMDILTSLSSVRDIKTEVDSQLYRPADFSFKTPSCEKFRTLTDWKPEIKLSQTLQDILDDWRHKLV